ncbi:MAG: ShlB/FhaC/HecB family hemolysin secretion/activation protein [Marinobacter sp.]
MPLLRLMFAIIGLFASTCGLAHPAVAEGLWSALSVSGNSTLSDDEMNGSLGVSADGLVFREHLLGVIFDRNSRTLEGASRESLLASYSFPLQGNYFAFSKRNNSRYSDQLSGTLRQQVHVLSDETNFSARRALFGWEGLQFDSVLRHRTRETRRILQGAWAETTAAQVSSLGMSSKRELIQLYGWNAATMVTFTRGLSINSRQAPTQGDYRNSDNFYKMLLGGSLGRELNDWYLGLSGRYQAATDQLPAAEQIRVVGSQLLEGFAGNSHTAASGGWMRIDADTPGFNFPFISGVRAGARLSLLRGWADVRSTRSNQYLNADAGELSLQLRTRYMRASTSIGRVLGDSPLLPDAGNSPNFRLSLTVDI